MRIAWMVIRLIYIVPFWLIKMSIYGKSNKYTLKEKYEFLRYVTTRANKAGRVTIKAYGVENLPKEDGYIMFPNHQGLYDVLAVLESNPYPFSVVMKKEARNLILVKQVFEMLDAKAIDREDIKQSLQIILEVTKEVMGGRNFLIFPEGTRTRNKNELLPFKGGSFKSATKAKCPIVPVALIDSYKPFDKAGIEKVTVQIHYLPPIEYEEYKDMKTTEIAAMVRDRIEKTIKEFEYPQTK